MRLSNIALSKLRPNGCSFLLTFRQCCGSGMLIPDKNYSIPDPGSKRSRIRIKELNCWNQNPKPWILALGKMIWDVHPVAVFFPPESGFFPPESGFFPIPSRIENFFPIPDRDFFFISWIQRSYKHRIADPQHCISERPDVEFGISFSNVAW